MNRKGILREGIITYALEKLFRVFVSVPALKKSKKVQSGIKDLNDSVEDLEKSLNAELKSIGSKKRVKIPKYKLKDFTPGR